jgi:glycosyltransferase involved in cell wall biosynthesis
VIGSDRGGIPLQIRKDKSGYVENPYDTDAWADHIVDLMTDKGKYSKLKQSTSEEATGYNHQYTTIPNVMRWLYLSNKLLTDKSNFNGNLRWVEELAKAA